ncbi:MAG: hypothetical protein ACTSRP_15395 [Candidatus Helarchaeota archaeon]
MKEEIIIKRMRNSKNLNIIIISYNVILYLIPIIYVMVFTTKNSFSNYVLNFIFKFELWNVFGPILIMVIFPIALFFIIYYTNFKKLEIKSKSNKRPWNIIDFLSKIIGIIISGSISLIIILIVIMILCIYDFYIGISISQAFVIIGLYEINYFFLWGVLYIFLFYSMSDLILKLISIEKMKTEIKNLKFWHNIYYNVILFYFSGISFIIIYITIEKLLFVSFEFWYLVLFIGIEIFHLILIFFLERLINKYKNKISAKLLEDTL